MTADISESMEVVEAVEETVFVPPQRGEAMFVKETAAYLGIGENEVREWMKHPAFPSAAVGKKGYVIFKTTLQN